MSRATSVLAEVVGLVHDLLRDAISAIVGTLASAIIEAIATFGLAIPLIIAQVQVKVGAKATEMAAHITGVLKSARTLAHNLTHLSGLLDMLRGMFTRAKNTAANAAHMLTGAKPATTAAGGATPHGPTTGTTAHTGTGTGHTARHTPGPRPPHQNHEEGEKCQPAGIRTVAMWMKRALRTYTLTIRVHFWKVGHPTRKTKRFRCGRKPLRAQRR